MTKPIQHLLIRADASPRMGTGHVMRCLALAQAWQGHGKAVFAAAECTPALAQRLKAANCELHQLAVPPGSPEDAAATVVLAGELGTRWLVADGYQFGADFQRDLRASGRQLLFFDDYGHAGEYVADLVLNQNLGADAALYARRAPYTRLLLGPRYALLRPEFLAWRAWRREIPPIARKVLVTLGGADPDNVTGQVIEALKPLPDLDVVVVVGGSNPHLEHLRSVLRSLSSAFRLVVDAPNMPELMAWADVAIAAGGTTSWELAFMGLPSLVLTLAENQIAVANALVSNGVACLGGRPPLSGQDFLEGLSAVLNDGARRSEMSAHGRLLVDGLGLQRVLAGMAAPPLTLRPVEACDCRKVWEWSNDASVRAVSFHPAPIPWETHERWFAARLYDPDCLFLMAQNNSGEAVGQIRFEVKNREAIVSVSLDPQFRGRGYGAALIRAATERLHQEREVRRTHAYIKPQNAASTRTFEQAGYSQLGETTVDSQPAIELVFQTDHE